MRKFSRLIAPASLLIATLGLAGMSQAQELRIGTASLGGAFYPVGQAISNLVNEHAEGYTMVPVVTQGAAENPRLLASGEVDIGIGNASTSFFAHKGEAPYADAIDVRTLGTLHSSVLHIVTLADSYIKTIEDLKGARVAVGPAGGGTLNLLRDVLTAHGLGFDDITPSFLSYADGFSQLSDGSVDVSVALSGYPAAAVIQTSTTNDIAFLSISDDSMARILEMFPFYSSKVLPSEVYGTQQPTTLLGVQNILITMGSMPDEQAYTLTKAIYGHLDEFAAENANAKQISAKDAYTVAVPLHPGAKRFFDEQ